MKRLIAGLIITASLLGCGGTIETWQVTDLDTGAKYAYSTYNGFTPSDVADGRAGLWIRVGNQAHLLKNFSFVLISSVKD